MDVAQLNFFLALGTVGMQIGALVMLGLFFMRKSPEFATQAHLIQKLTLPVSLALITCAALFALVHENVYGLEPCYWCWWQRIVMFPQIVLLGMALVRAKYRETVMDASIVLSTIGAAIALYHHALQIFPGSGLPCPATGPSCAQITFFEFGYITYPMMALSLFAFVIVAMLFVKSAQQSS